VFDDIHGLTPERAARLTSLAEQSLSLLAQGGGMDSVQRFLRDQGAGVIDSIAVTRELLGAGPGSLVKATSAAGVLPDGAVVPDAEGDISESNGPRSTFVADGDDVPRAVPGATRHPISTDPDSPSTRRASSTHGSRPAAPVLKESVTRTWPRSVVKRSRPRSFRPDSAAPR
jgi:hypothetical protein